MKKIIFLIIVFVITQKLNAQQNSSDSESVPSELYSFKLSQNYPNPAKESTFIKLQLNTLGPVTLKLYDMLGNSISSLLDQNMMAGIYSIPVETENMPNGIYFYVLKKGSVSQTMKLIISK